MIAQETVDRILEISKIEEVISDFISLKRSGSGLSACCPFHNEKTPSFHVSPAKGLYKCFGCGKAGTAVNFVMEHEAMSYPEALKYLAKKYGIPVVEKEESAEELQEKKHRESLYIVSDFAKELFHSNLKEGEGRSLGYAYFKERGLEDSTIEKYSLGWAKRSGKDLYLKAQEKAYKDEYLIDTGLCYKNDKGEFIDRFYDRVMFPIHSTSGQVIAFGGRTLKSGHPGMKYVNTPTTEIYIKEKSLYGIFFAKSEISKKNKCYLVEGYLDVLSFHQLGILNTVASSGTSLTIEQVRLIKRFTDNISIIYDADSAGIKATIRAIDLILQEGLKVTTISLPEGEDPDSFSRKYSLEKVIAFLESNEKDFITYKSNLLGEEINDPLKKIELIHNIADSIALIPDAIQRTVFIQQSEAILKMESELIAERVRNIREKQSIKDRIALQHTKRKQEQEKQESLKSITNSNSSSSKQSNSILAAIERDLLWFILNEGLSEIYFPLDSEFKEDDGIVVAEFIRCHLEEASFSFENDIYREIYDEYFKYYDDASLKQSDIIQRLLNGERQDISQLVIGLTEQKYTISIHNLKASMTNTNTILATYVPKAIIMYHIKRLIAKNLTLTKELNSESDMEKQAEILKELQAIVLQRKNMEEKLNKII